VARDTPRTSAASSSVNPPNARSSTRRALSASLAEGVVTANTGGKGGQGGNGGKGGNGYGGGAAVVGGNVTLEHDTIQDNSAQAGAGGAPAPAGGASTSDGVAYSGGPGGASNGSGGSATGGGVYTTGSVVTLLHTRMDDNTPSP